MMWTSRFTLANLTMLILAALLLSVTYPLNAQHEQLTIQILRVTALGNVNVREAASTQEAPIASLSSGETITVLDQVSDGESVSGNSLWYHVQLDDGTQGFVWSGAVSQPETEEINVYARNRVSYFQEEEITRRLALPDTDPQKITINDQWELVNAQGWIWHHGMTLDNSIVDSGFLMQTDSIKTEGTDVTINLNLNPIDMAARPADQDRVIDVKFSSGWAENFIELQNSLVGSRLRNYPDFKPIQRVPEGSIININFVALFDHVGGSQSFVWSGQVGNLNGKDITVYGWAIDYEELPNGGKLVEARVYSPGGFPDFTPEHTVNSEIIQVLITTIMGYERPGQYYSARDDFNEAESERLSDFYTTSGYNASWITLTLADETN
jgi:hypothetical protein